MGTVSEQTVARLRETHGAAADEMIGQAVGMIERAARRWPAVHDFLAASGLRDSPHLIEQLAARAAHRALLTDGDRNRQ
ncbi:hypothetical protein FBZ82_1269 [Azospirillum brasilense]|uniref:Uncharacterized protein n=1 Tax=Azospirillum brasilense TaxID=192 RepID=A0A560AFU7_AZOBR|nr:hypothetical protein [Azospirillum brasilense]TWA59248.1 hypothetical protein FBZ82_1269 [Azospirillum brasilense]